MRRNYRPTRARLGLRPRSVSVRTSIRISRAPSNRARRGLGAASRMSSDRMWRSAPIGSPFASPRSSGRRRTSRCGSCRPPARAQTRLWTRCDQARLTCRRAWAAVRRHDWIPESRRSSCAPSVCAPPSRALRVQSGREGRMPSCSLRTPQDSHASRSAAPAPAPAAGRRRVHRRCRPGRADPMGAAAT